MFVDWKRRGRPGRAGLLVATVGVVLLAAACSSSSGAAPSDGDAAAPALAELPTTDPVTVRLGYFPNVTHAPALVAVQEGLFERELGAIDATLETSTFNAGPEATEAILSDALDITYIGPSPAANAFQKSDGRAVRVVAGSTSGGAELVVQPGITSAADLEGEVVASPQLGNTQDVALRTWLSDQGLSTDTTGGGDVSIMPQANAEILASFQDDEIAGAWVPTPWGTRLVQEGGGEVLVDEASLWPGGDFATTVVLVRTEFLAEHPTAVAAVLRAHLAAIRSIADDPEGAQVAANAEIEAATGKPLPADLVAASFGELRFTPDPLASTVLESAAHAVAAGVAEEYDLDGLFRLDLLDQLLAADGQPKVAAP